MNKLKAKPTEAVEYAFNKAFFGLFAIMFGLAFLVNNSGLFSLNINLGMIWPLFIIFIGLSLFRKRDVVSTALGSTVATICVTLFFISMFSYIPVNYGEVTSFPIGISKDAGVEKANIFLNAGAGEIKVYGTDTGKLVDGELITNLMTAKIDSQTKNNIQDVNIGVEGRREWFHGSNIKNEFNIGIDKDTPVTLDIKSGASDNNIDLTGVKAESVALHTGASNVNLKMGDGLDTSNVVVEAGASSISLSFPKTVGVRLFLESGMSSQELPDFISIDKNTYQSLNYESSQKKINASVKIGMASLYVNWYEPEKNAKVSLFYYNQGQDKENTCDYQFVLPVEREISASGDIIKDTVELLIKGQLTQVEKANGFTTDLPNPDFKLLDSSLSDSGTLILNFTEVPGLTSGDSCKTGLLMEEILKTVRQFPQVKKIVFQPDSLFEP